ncbi:PHA/PHB synthase family protein [Pseudonocardia xinjiangensis]|uniref:PHA/PHB synthase family protein n=1 Tax=Pseudonocardia xinjiangensis TaxID=75289 RepID=UPI003D8BB03D
MTSGHPGGRGAGLDAAEAALGLELLLTGSATGGPLRRVLPLAPAARLAASLASRPLTVARRGTVLAVELARIGLGRSSLAPAPQDQRYADPAWDHPLLRRIVQTHLAAGATVSDLIADAELDGADDERVRSAVGTLADALAPSNTPLNPLAWRSALGTGGASIVRGAARLVGDLGSPPRVPATTEPDAFEVGTHVAATPGAVVLRTPVFELIQYLPQTEEVRDLPLLVVPPMATRYYLADLAPGRSIVEHLVRGGQQVFLLSWRNPGPEHASWDLDTYGQAVLDAMDACEHITRTHRTSLMAVSSSGGTVTAMLLAHLAAIGAQERVASVTFVVAALDREEVDAPVSPAARQAAQAAVAASQRRGHLDGAALVEAHAWAHPDDLVWPYWVHSYLCGEAPPASEDLFWLADTVRVPAGLHRDLVAVALGNALATPGAAEMLGTAVDLSKVDRDAYVVAALGGHSAVWRSCYRTTGLLGGTTRFVLATNGSTASVIDPPGTPAAGFRVAETTPPAAERWLAAARPVPGSWWSDHLAWLGDRSGPVRDAPPELGGRGLHAVAPAPGEYVLQR